MALSRTTSLFSLLFLIGIPAVLEGQDPVPFDSPRWQHADSEVLEVGGRQALQGTAVLPDADFRNGVIEYELFLTGTRSYPGVYFRLRDGSHAEHIYVRPHRAGLYPDAIQYTPVVNGIAEWQFYNGPGFTNEGEFTEGEWIPVRVEVMGSQARVFVEDLETPALVIPELKSGIERGALALTGPKDGSAFFSNFRFWTDAEVSFEPAPREEIPAGMIRDWSVTGAMPMARFNRNAYPNFYTVFLSEWQDLQALESGIVDIARRTGRENADGDLVLARHVFWSDEDREMNLNIGYSDEVDLFFNGQRLFRGQSRYQQRDPSFLGIMGLYDQVPVQVRQGLNEVLLMVGEVFGGWGFMVQAEGAVESVAMDHGATEQVWMTPDTFLTPETVLKDPLRDLIYVSNFDSEFSRKTEPSGFISRLTTKGEVTDLKWVEGLQAPAGMAIWLDTLYVVERRSLAAIELKSGILVARWDIPDPDFPNDIAIDGDGTIYISDTRSGDWADSRILRFRKGVFDVFANEGINRANGIWIQDGSLLVGSSGDGFLKRVGLQTGVVETVLSLGAGVIDGIRIDEEGNILVSHWMGRIYRISPEGSLVEILDTSSDRWNTADFEYLPEENLLLIPTFLENRVRAVRILSPGQPERPPVPS